MESAEDKRKNIDFLKASNEMLENTKREAESKGKTQSISLIDGIKKDVASQLNSEGVIVKDTPTEAPKEIKKGEEVQTQVPQTFKIKENRDVITDFDSKNIDVRYDMISLPSKGQVYSHKKNMLPVGYLTAKDENLIIEPNMYVNGLIMDILLKNKILDNTIDPEDLCKGDRDQIILWLRATGYGPDFPITVIDPETKEPFDTVADLRLIKAKPFNLIGDENGWFEFVLPQSKDIIKFSYPTRREERVYEKEIENTNEKVQRDKFSKIYFDLESVLDSEIITMESGDIDYLKDVVKNMKYIETKFSDGLFKTNYPEIITKRLTMAVKSINGNTNKEFIKDYCENMLTLDAKELRTFISENEPSLDYKITVEKPESLGGGSFETFLELDLLLFLNIA